MSSQQTDEKDWCDTGRSRQFFAACKDCEFDADSALLDTVKSIINDGEDGANSININYISVNSDEYPLKFIFKYCKPITLEFLMDTFVPHKNASIDWMIIDNDTLKNNVLHYMASAVAPKQESEAMKILDLLFDCDKEYKDKLVDTCHNLLYQINDYNYTPAQYCQKRKRFEIGYKMESIQYQHIMNLLTVECSIPREVSLEIVKFTFELFHGKKLYD